MQIHTIHDKEGIAGLADWLKEKNSVTSDHAIKLRTDYRWMVSAPFRMTFVHEIKLWNREMLGTGRTSKHNI